ncbi:hypothetical protein ES319_D09G009700v1 [Gossypium barbadense]|uniref:Uncharacterized protein n=1 Tax=Gossypium barbadense TaxID=3634 RepID=A0A5J5PXM8_GOSBA|nr:hypothetical protein ES319_D09G009700v1 [Gossypium barbadense]
MLSFAGNGFSTERKLFNSGFHQLYNCNFLSSYTLTPFVQASPVCRSENFSTVHVKHLKIGSQHRNAVKVCATRRRRAAYSRTETYVLLEPGEDEKFVSEEELKAKLKGWLENWPDGDVGSIQWYEVRLE